MRVAMLVGVLMFNVIAAGLYESDWVECEPGTRVVRRGAGPGL